MSIFTTLDLQLTRYELGLGALDVNDHLNYIVGDQILGAQQTWNRTTVKSPYVDGEFTVSRAMAQRQETLQIQVLGPDQTTLQSNLQALTDTLSQFRFQLTLTMDETSRTWQCETADYTVDYDKSRWMGRQILVTASIPTYPIQVS